MPEEVAIQGSYMVRVVLVIAGGMLIHLSLGSFYTFGNASLYMISYLRNRTSNENKIINEDNVYINLGSAIALPFGITVGGIISRLMGTRFAVAIGCSIYCTGVALTYYTIKKSLVSVIFSYGFMATFGNAMAYGPPIENVIKWVPSRPTFAVGLVVCGFGGGALVFNEVITWYVNPNNLAPDETDNGEKYFTEQEILDHVPTLFILLAVIYLTMQVIGILAISEPPDHHPKNSCWRRLCAKINKGVVSTEVTELLHDVEEQHQSTRCISVRDGLVQLFKNKNAYLLWLMIFLIDCGMQFALTLYKAYGQTFIKDDHFLALTGAISSLFNAFFRPVWGIVMDKFGFQVAMKSLSACFVVLACTLLYTEQIGDWAFLIWMSGLYASFCGIWSVGPSTLGKLFGASNVAINMGFIFSAMGAATIAGGFMGMHLQQSIGWHFLFLLSGGLGAIAFFLTFLFNERDFEGNVF